MYIKYSTLKYYSVQHPPKNPAMYTTWTDLEKMMPNERKQAQKDKDSYEASKSSNQSGAVVSWQGRRKGITNH